MKTRYYLAQILNLSLVLSSAFMFWKGLSWFTNSESPIVVVLSGSMEPAFQRGDLLFLWNRQETLHAGDIVVYNIRGKSIPIVHRIVREHNNHNDKGSTATPQQLLLTKGDNNAVDDLNLYAYKQSYLTREKDIVGSVKGYLPKLGYITILLTENKYVKIGLLTIMALSSLLQNE